MWWLDVSSERKRQTTSQPSGTSPSSNLNKSTDYVQKTLDLSAYKGQTIRVYFNGTEDASLKTSFFPDDTAVSITR